MTSTETVTSFDSLGLNAQLLNTVKSLGFEAPTPIQQEFIPVDALLGQTVTAQNGSTQTKGTARGIDEDGNLRLKTQTGAILNVSAGDIIFGESI